MCGLFVLINQGPGGVSDAILKSAKAIEAALYTRGPDAQHHRFSHDRHAWMLHTRLHINGDTQAIQPLISQDGKLMAVVNGEFYQYASLRKQLEAKGCVFLTDTDSELLLHLYQQYGLALFDYLEGEFAFVLYDQHKRRALAARDRFGIKPLYYQRDKSELSLSSNIKALCAASSKQPQWNKQALIHTMAFQYQLPGESLFQGVEQIRPGHYMLCEQGETQEKAYWRHPLPHQRFHGLEKHQLVEHIRDALLHSVEKRLPANHAWCVHLSGGVDSSAVLGMAQHLSKTPPQAISVAFEDGGDYNELAIAQRSAADLGLEHHIVSLSREDMCHSFSDAVYATEGLGINGHLAAKYLLNQRLNAEGIRIALTGEGADELMWGYPHLQYDARQLGLVAGSSAQNTVQQNPLLKGVMLSNQTTQDLSCIQNSLGYVPGFIQAKSSFYALFQNTIKSDYLTVDYQPYQDLIASAQAMGRLADYEPLEQGNLIWMDTALTSYILNTLGDGAEMAWSVEGRLPFLDHHLFELMAGIATADKLTPGIEKALMREAVKPFVTDEVYRRPKHPFIAPPLFEANNPWLSELMDIDRLRAVDFIDPVATQNVYRRWQQGDETNPFMQSFWCLLASMILMHERFMMRVN